MINVTTLLLDLDGVSVVLFGRLGDGSRRAHLVTADEAARACPACGVFAYRVKGTAVTRPPVLPYVDSRSQFCGTSGAGTAARPTAPAGPTPSGSRRSRPVPG